jgi:hypothetical protein
MMLFPAGLIAEFVVANEDVGEPLRLAVDFAA